MIKLTILNIIIITAVVLIIILHLAIIYFPQTTCKPMIINGIILSEKITTPSTIKKYIII